MAELDTNIEKLNGFLTRFEDKGVLNQIGGQAVAAQSGRTFETSSPVDESLICQVARGDADDIDAAGRLPGRFPAWPWATLG